MISNRVFRITLYLCGPRRFLFSSRNTPLILLTLLHLQAQKTVDTPLELYSELIPTDGTPFANRTRYHQLICKLVHLFVMRLDIAYAIIIVSQFVFTPHSAHYNSIMDSFMFGIYMYNFYFDKIYIYLEAYLVLMKNKFLWFSYVLMIWALLSYLHECVTHMILVHSHFFCLLMTLFSWAYICALWILSNTSCVFGMLHGIYDLVSSFEGYLTSFSKTILN